MSYSAEVLNIMIAAPSDIIDEQKIVHEESNHWNLLHSESLNIILKILDWKTDTHSVVGTNPQETIDKQILHNADLLIVIFWKRLGTEVLNSKSGTLHELEEHLKLNKPAMLFYSLVPANPDDIDLEQLNEVRTLKDRYKDKALYFEYHSQEEFRNLVFNQISLFLTKRKTEIEKQSKTVKSTETRDIKELIQDPSKFITLEDIVKQEVSETLLELNENDLSFSEITSDTLPIILQNYENILRKLQEIIVTISHWGKGKQLELVTRILARIAENQVVTSSGILKKRRSGISNYPSLLLTYTAGIASVYANNYQLLYSIFSVKYKEIDSQNCETLVLKLGQITRDLASVLNLLPDYERHYISRSSYILDKLKPLFERQLFIGNDFDSTFDKFELLFTLNFIFFNQLNKDNFFGYWGPPGLYYYKIKNSWSDRENVINTTLLEAEIQKENWLPLKSGMFGGSYEKFLEILKGYSSSMFK